MVFTDIGSVLSLSPIRGRPPDSCGGGFRGGEGQPGIAGAISTTRWLATSRAARGYFAWGAWGGTLLAGLPDPVLVREDVAGDRDVAAHVDVRRPGVV